MADYRSAPEIHRVAREVIEEHHPVLAQRGPIIEWIMTRPSSASGKVPDFKIRKVTGVNAFLAGPKSDSFVYQAEPFIAVEVSVSFWNSLEDPGGENGFCDHVVSHLAYDYEKGTWSVEGPQFGEFVGVLDRHGFWRPGADYRTFAETVSEQLSLLAETPSDIPSEADTDKVAEQESNNFDMSISYHGNTVQTNAGTLHTLANGGGS